MGTSIVRNLTPAEATQSTQTIAAMSQLGATSGSPATGFRFLAAFDGTNNDRSNLGLSGSPYKTNVGNIADQAVAANATGNLTAKYYPGVGTGGQNGGTAAAAITPTAAIEYAARLAIKDFADAAQHYMETPGAKIEDISASA